MDSQLTDPMATIRLLESWLPLAQAENERHAWGYSGAQLEHLIVSAAPALRQTSSLLAARAVLWYYYRVQERGTA